MVVDTKEYLDMVSDLLREGREQVAVTVAGSSMVPFLHHGDKVYLDPLPEVLKPGDVVLYRRAGGQYVLHRIVKIHADGSFTMLGDAQVNRERIEDRSALRGIVTRVMHRGKFLTAGSLRWKFFEKIWIRVVPLRPVIMKTRGILGRKWR